jgi:hypothetical protein
MHPSNERHENPSKNNPRQDYAIFAKRYIIYSILVQQHNFAKKKMDK